jgi:trigger factor
MQTSVETLGEDRIRLTVEVPTHDVDHAFEHALRDLSKGVKIPGFRAGKVPPGVLRSRIGTEAIVEEALRGHLSSWFGRAMDVARLEPVSRPEVDYETDPAEGSPWTFTAEVQVAPTATFPEQLVLEAPRAEVEIPADAVDQRVERMRGLGAQIIALEDTPAATGHLALIDFTSTVAGKKVRNGSAKDYQFEIGSGKLLDGLEEALIGMQVGETREVDIDLPNDGPDPKLNGKTAQFAITLRDLKQRVLPDVDDAFAAEISEFETVAELRADIERQLLERAAEAVDGEYRAAVLAALGAAVEVEVPEMMVARRLDDRLENAARGMAQRGIRFEDYLNMTGQSIMDVAAQLRPEAEASARQELALRAFADREQIVIDDEEVQAFVREQAQAEKDPEGVERRVLESPAAMESVREELRLKRALDRAVEIARPVPVTRPSFEDGLRNADEVADASAEDGDAS